MGLKVVFYLLPLFLFFPAPRAVLSSIATMPWVQETTTTVVNFIHHQLVVVTLY